MFFKLHPLDQWFTSAVKRTWRICSCGWEQFSPSEKLLYKKRCYDCLSSRHNLARLQPTNLRSLTTVGWVPTFLHLQEFNSSIQVISIRTVHPCLLVISHGSSSSASLASSNLPVSCWPASQFTSSTPSKVGIKNYIIQWNLLLQKALTRPQLRLLVAGFPPRWPGFEPRSDLVGFVVVQVALERNLS